MVLRASLVYAKTGEMCAIDLRWFSNEQAMDAQKLRVFLSFFFAIKSRNRPKAKHFEWELNARNEFAWPFFATKRPCRKQIKDSQRRSLLARLHLSVCFFFPVYPSLFFYVILGSNPPPRLKPLNFRAL